MVAFDFAGVAGAPYELCLLLVTCQVQTDEGRSTLQRNPNLFSDFTKTDTLPHRAQPDSADVVSVVVLIGTDGVS